MGTLNNSLPYNLLGGVLIAGLIVTLLDTSFILLAPHISWCTISTRASYEIPCRASDEIGMRMHYSLQSIGYQTIWIGPVMIFASFAIRFWMTRESLVEEEDYESSWVSFGEGPSYRLPVANRICYSFISMPYFAAVFTTFSITAGVIGDGWNDDFFSLSTGIPISSKNFQTVAERNVVHAPSFGMALSSG